MKNNYFLKTIKALQLICLIHYLLYHPEFPESLFSTNPDFSLVPSVPDARRKGLWCMLILETL